MRITAENIELNIAMVLLNIKTWSAALCAKVATPELYPPGMVKVAENVTVATKVHTIRRVLNLSLHLIFGILFSLSVPIGTDLGTFANIRAVQVRRCKVDQITISYKHHN